MNQETARINALRAGRHVIAAILQVVDADLALSVAALDARNAENVARTGRKPLNKPKSARVCLSCGLGVYRNVVVGRSEDGKRIQRYRCDTCGHLSTDKTDRPERVIAIGEAVKARRAAEVIA